jgi:hypothetical protein
VGEEVTHSICKTCLRLIDAERLEANGAMYIRGICPEHGPQMGVREPNAEFYQFLKDISTPENLAFRESVSATMVNVTDRCQIKCKDCYHAPDKRGVDPSIDSLMPLFHRVTRPAIGIQGAEPTVRDDLPELITRVKQETGKPVALCTNGLRLADPGYCQTLRNTEVDNIAFSLHTPEYSGTAAYARKLLAVDNIIATGLNVSGFSTTINEPHELPSAWDHMWQVLTRFPKGTQARFRCAGGIPGEEGSNVHLSQLVAKFGEVLTNRGLKGQIMRGSHTYLLLLEVEGYHVTLVRWPRREETDMEDLALVPMSCLFVPEMGETPGIHQGHVFAHLRRGGDMQAMDHVEKYRYGHGQRPL